MLAALLFLAAPARATDHELNFELGRFSSYDPNFSEVFNGGHGLASWGFRGGVGVGSFTTVVLSWQHDVTGGEVAAYDEDEDDGDYEDATFWLALTTNQLALGPKFTWALTPWLRPYATAQAVGLFGAARMDDDIEDDENVNEFARSGFAPGGLAAGGLELVVARADRPVRPATYLEMGYGHLLPLKLDELGELRFNGFYLHWGVGARF